MVNYVDITKAEFEDWITSLGYPWKLKPGTAGVYVLYFNKDKTVALEVQSSLRGVGHSVGYANASMSMSLVSTVSGFCLNRKAQEQGHFKRTKNWRNTMKEGVDRFWDSYSERAEWYNLRASIKDMEAYKKDMLFKINSIPQAAENSFFDSLREQVNRGGVLSNKQLQAIDDALASASPIADAETQIDRLKDVEKLRLLYVVMGYKHDPEFSKVLIYAKDYHLDRWLQQKYTQYMSDMIEYVVRNGLDKIKK